MIGFVVAMEKEASHFLSVAEIKEERTIAMKKVYIGEFCGKSFALIVGGIGKVNAGMATQIMIDNFKPKMIINFGTAGGKDATHQKVGDVALIDRICQYDFDLSEIDDVNIGYMQDYDAIYFKCAYEKYKGDAFVVSTLASADRFTTKTWALEAIAGLGATVCDMEAGAVGQVAYSNGVDFYVLKLLTDVSGSEEESIFGQYLNSVKAVCEKIPNAIRELILHIEE